MVAGSDGDLGEQLERASADVLVRPPVLVVLPDPDARVRCDTSVLGAPLLPRLATAAHRSGFARVIMAPGTTTTVAGARELATFEPIEGPALVVYEATAIRRTLLELMVAHPLEPDEGFTLYDALGRPAAAFVGLLRQVPSQLPIGEELPYPEGLGPDDVVRVVYPGDLARAEALVVTSDEVFPRARSWWRRRVGLPTLRAMAAMPGPLARLEVVAILAALSALPLALAGRPWMLPLAALALLIGVHVSKLLKSLRLLRRGIGADEGDAAGERIARATRPLGHAAITGGITYGLIAQADRADIAALVVLATGAAATVIDLVQARLLLRGHIEPVFALPDAHAVAARIGLPLPPWIEGAPLFELLVLVMAIPMVPELPWTLLVAGAVARLWRWYAGPVGAGGD